MAVDLASEEWTEAVLKVDSNSELWAEQGTAGDVTSCHAG